MREIKFRGIYVDTGEFVYGSLILGLTKDPEFEVIFDGTTYYKVKAETVGQYIDLPDKNGWQIYEGDIIKLDSRDIIIVRPPELFECDAFIVFGYEFCSGFFIEDAKELALESFYAESPEIIGNIHKNPELLKKGENYEN